MDKDFQCRMLLAEIAGYFQGALFSEKNGWVKHSNAQREMMKSYNEKICALLGTTNTFPEPEKEVENNCITNLIVSQ